jgi:protein gp37
MTTEARLKNHLYWDQALSLVTGCTKCGPECERCWAESEAWTRLHHSNPAISSRFTGTVERGKWTGRIILHTDRLKLPERRRKPTVYSIWTDLFHEDVTDEFIRRALLMMWGNPRHRFIVCTKRPERIEKALDELADDGLPNILFMTTAGTQEMVQKRLVPLLRLKQMFPNIHLGLSAEPLLENIWIHEAAYLSGFSRKDGIPLDGVFCGGETGKHARVMNPEFPRNLRVQCAEWNIPFFFKSWGEWIPKEETSGKTSNNTMRKARHTAVENPALHSLDGIEYHELPKILQV